MWPVHPGRVVPKLADGVLTYEVMQETGGAKVILQARDVFHVRGMGDGISGYSVLRFAAETLGLGLAAQRHAGAFFGEGMGKRMIATVKGATLDAAGREALRKRLQQDRATNPVGFRKMPIIDGLEVNLTDMGIPPDEAQFLEQREFGVEEVARWFRMSLAKLQYHKRAQGWGTLDALNTDYAVDFLQPWVTTWEEECWLKLFAESEQSDHFAKFNLNALMRGDTTSRMTYYGAGIKDGWLSQNDVRELEDMDPIEDPAADVYRTQAQMVPLAMPDEEPDEEDAPNPTMTFTPQPPPAEDEEGDTAEAEPEEEAPGQPEEDPVAKFTTAAMALRPVAESIARGLVRVEANAATRALAKHARDASAFTAWAEKFYADHAEKVAESLAPIGAALEWCAGQAGVGGVGAGAPLLAVVSEYRKSVNAGDGEDRRVEVLVGAAWAALVGNVKEVSRA
jgi:HK97 family phage portal protein